MKNPKKILIFSLAYYPSSVAGAEVAIKEITERFSDNEAVFDMVTLWDDSNLPRCERIGNVNIYRVGKSKLLFPFTAFFRSARLRRKNRYDFIWSMMANRAG